MTTLSVATYTLPGARLEGENPLPFFRDPVTNMTVKTIEPFPPEKREHLGWETGYRVLPYRMQDQYSRRKEPITFKALILENEFLKATFLPEVGGRLVSLIHKPLERELLHRNPVFQPANLAIRNAWFSGGIEWNFGQYGHSFTTCSPLFAAEIRGVQGEPGLRLYEFERCKRLFWQLDFYLPPGLPFLIAYARVHNPNNEPTSMYYWTNIAVNEAPDVRVLSPANTALYGVFQPGGPAFGCTKMPGLPSLNGADGTYSLNSPFANEFFFQCDDPPMPWEAALDGQGSGLIEASTARLKYRKLFCWGTHRGGRQWQEFLSQPGEAYIEIQAGLAPTQVHGLPMPARATWDWTEAFGYIEADPRKVHGSDWPAAWGCVDAALKSRLSLNTLSKIEADCRDHTATPSTEILHTGSGWGALELRRRTRMAEDVPPQFVFPADTLGSEQQKWLALLENGALPEQPPEALPGEWMVQPEWQNLLEASIQSQKQDHARNWYALLHLGVMRLEQFDEAGAAAAWEESLRLQPSVWAYRNLAVLCLRQKNEEQGLAYYEQAWDLLVRQGSPIPMPLAVEYMEMLAAARQFERGMAVYQSLPAEVQHADRVQILRGQFAMELDDLPVLEEVLARQYAVVREGETVLSDLWFELHARRESARTGRPLDDDLRREVRQLFPPPSRIDFRSIEK